MSNPASLSGEEGLGIGVAVVAHGALAALLVWHATREVEPIKPPERIEVSLASEISLESTAPDPSAEPAASFAPVVSELPAPPEPELAPPEPEAVPTRTPRTTTPPPRPTPTASRTATPRPTPTPTRSSAPRPTPTPSRSSAPRPTPTPTPSRRAGGSRFNDAFSPGTGTNDTNNTGQPAATFGPAQAADLRSAITRQLRRNWSAPQGVDAELLVTTVSWRLNRNGSVAGTPRCVNQSGINDSNRPQAQLHCERAIRAVQLGDFSQLPQEFYSRWDDLEWTFDRRL